MSILDPIIVITSAKYYKNPMFPDDRNVGIRATVNGEIKDVPLDPKNLEHIAIQKWVAEGNTIADAD